MMIDQQLQQGLAMASDAFDYIYECISGSHGEELREHANDLYQSVSIDYRLHPDDDFEDIINRVLDDLGV
jgi:hypothetical protein